MHLKRWIVFGSALLLPSCLVYTQDLLSQGKAGGSSGSGGKDSGGGGGTSSGGDGTDPENTGGGMLGGSGPGGSGGSDQGDGGSGGSGGSGGHSGGSGGSGGTGGNSGGSDSGGGSTGGSGGSAPAACSSATSPCLVDDLNHAGSASYSNLPFYGKWDRYIQDTPPGVFTAASVGAMVEADPNDGTNGFLHIAATNLTDWGLGMFITLKNGASQDISSYKELSFRARTTNTEKTINVAIADAASHRPVCTMAKEGVDCDKHMRSPTAAAAVISDEWQVITVPLNTFVDDAVAEVPRVAPLDLTKVYAIHFQIETLSPGTVADFYIDDVILK